MPRICIIEDDENIREIVLYALRKADFEAQGYETGADFFSGGYADGSVNFDLVILDIMLPGEDGLKILRRLRGNPSTRELPVVMLTAKTSEYDKVKGLDMGADDYISKPFGVMELISRIRALLRRAKISPVMRLEFESICLDTSKRLVSVDNNPITLTFLEYELMLFLLVNKGLALSREKIMDAVWGYDFEGETRTVDMHIYALRQKLGSAGEYIKTIRGIGYRFGE